MIENPVVWKKLQVSFSTTYHIKDKERRKIKA